MKTYLKLPVCLALAWFSLAAGASAVTLYNNGAPNQVNGNEMTTYIQADDFKLATTAIVMGVTFWDIDNSGYQGSIVWQVYSDASGTPGTLLYSGTASPTRTATGQTVAGYAETSNTFNVPNLTLATGTYWLGLHNGPLSTTSYGNNPFLWETTAANTSDASQQEALPAASGFAATTSGYEHAFLITGVPEPGTWAMLGVGTVGLALVRRRRRAR